MTAFFDRVQRQMHILLPLGFIMAAAQIINDFFMSRDGYFATVAGWQLRAFAPVGFLGRLLGYVAYGTSTLIIAALVAMVVYDYLGSRTEAWLWSAGTFLVVWTFENSEPDGLNWLIAIVFIGVALGLNWLINRLPRGRYTVAGLIFFVLMALSDWLQNLNTQAPMQVLLRYVAQFIEATTQNLGTVLLWSIGGATLAAIGLIVPGVLANGTTMSAVDLTNLENHWAQPNAALTNMDTYYTLLKPFAFGVSGALVAFGLAVLWVNWRQHRPNNTWGWVVLLAIFNQLTPMLMLAPLLWRFRVWWRTLVVLVVNIIVGYGLIHLGWVSAAVFQVPRGTPMILFGFFSTNADWRYLVVVPVLLGLNMRIYLPLVKQMISEGQLDD
jgi:hypothetical protein